MIKYNVPSGWAIPDMSKPLATLGYSDECFSIDLKDKKELLLNEIQKFICMLSVTSSMWRVTIRQEILRCGIWIIKYFGLLFLLFSNF